MYDCFGKPDTMLGLNRDNEIENGSYYNVLYRVYEGAQFKGLGE